MHTAVKQFIEDNGLIQSWVAKNVLGISRQYFWQKIHGYVNFTPEEKEKLAVHFNVPVEELFPEEEVPA